MSQAVGRGKVEKKGIAEATNILITLKIDKLSFWNNFRLTEKLQKYYRVFLYILHLHLTQPWEICQNCEINIGIILLTKPQTLSGFYQLFY